MDKARIIAETAARISREIKAAAIMVSGGVRFEGMEETRSSSSIIVHNLDENPLVKAVKECQERIKPEVMSAVMSISFDIALAGREGKKIGAAFIVGDSEEVMKRSHQIILNPYEGHEEAFPNF